MFYLGAHSGVVGHIFLPLNKGLVVRYLVHGSFVQLAEIVGVLLKVLLQVLVEILLCYPRLIQTQVESVHIRPLQHSAVLIKNKKVSLSTHLKRGRERKTNSKKLGLGGGGGRTYSDKLIGGFHHESGVHCTHVELLHKDGLLLVSVSSLLISNLQRVLVGLVSVVEEHVVLQLRLGVVGLHVLVLRSALVVFVAVVVASGMRAMFGPGPTTQPAEFKSASTGVPTACHVHTTTYRYH